MSSVPILFKGLYSIVVNYVDAQIAPDLTSGSTFRQAVF